MKNTLKLSLFLTLIIVSTYGNAANIVAPVETEKMSLINIDDELVIQKKEYKVSINLLNLDLNPIKIIIRDGLGRIIFHETINDNKTIQKTFNFTNAYQGSYSIKVKDGSKTYNKEIEII